MGEKNTPLRLLIGILLLFCNLSAVAQEPINDTTTTACTLCGVRESYDSYEFGTLLNTSNSELAPYYISSNQGGCITQKTSALAYASVHHAMNRPAGPTSPPRRLSRPLCACC